MKISIIGTGNIAWHLGLILEDKRHAIMEVFGRDLSKAKQLAGLFYNANACDTLDFSESPSRVFILAVSDDAMKEVCSQIILPEGAILVHTSGTKSLSELQQWMLMYHDLPVNCGVFYPLMTFTKGKKIDFSSVPFCIEAAESWIEKILVSIAQDISQTVYLVSSEERMKLHLAAVFSCNFTNHLLGIAKAILDEEEIPFDLLRPLINETLSKGFMSNHPFEVQTGPAIRRDTGTIHQHLALLQENKKWLEVYEILTESIQLSSKREE